MGGHCLPVDPFYLSWRAREFDMATEFIELAGKVNQQMPYHCVERSSAPSTTRASRCAGRGSPCSASPTSRASATCASRPALKILALLAGLGADLRYHDPYVPELPEPALRSASLDEALEGADLAVIVTAHPGVDHDARRRASAAGGRPARRHAPRRRRRRGCL